jgi:hypothetical protein
MTAEQALMRTKCEYAARVDRQVQRAEADLREAGADEEDVAANAAWLREHQWAYWPVVERAFHAFVAECRAGVELPEPSPGVPHTHELQ